MAKSRGKLFLEKMNNSGLNNTSNTSSTWSRGTAMTAKTGTNYAGSTKTISDDDFWTPRGFLATAYQKIEAGKQSGNELLSMYNELTKDPTSRLYNAYSQPTNQAVSNLAALGFDTSVLNSNWYELNKSWIRDNLEYRSGSTNAPSAPTKKSSWENKVAYELYQWGNSEAQTQEAEKQWKDLQDDLYYWAQRNDRNYSDQYILDNKIDWSKYNLLKEMDEDPNSLNPKEYNRAIGYSKDAMYGVLWAARNPEYTGDLEGAMAYSYLGKGNQWQDNPEIDAKLDPNSDQFNPYSLGSTNMDEAARQCHVLSFGTNWLDENRDLNYGTPEEQKLYRQVETGINNATAANKALAALDLWAQDKLSGETDYNKAKKKLDTLLKKGKVTVTLDGQKQEVDLSILNKMDVSVGKEGARPTGDLLPMAWGVDYKYDEYIQKVYQQCDTNKNRKTETDYTESINKDVTTTKDGATITPQTPVTNGQSDAVVAAQDETLRESKETIDTVATPAEQTGMKNSWSMFYDAVKSTVDGLIDFIRSDSKLVNDTVNVNVGELTNSVLQDSALVGQFGIYSNDLPDLKEEKATLEEQLGDIVYRNSEFVFDGWDGKLESQPGWNLLTESQKANLESMRESDYDDQSIANQYNIYLQDIVLSEENEKLSNRYQDVVAQINDAEKFIAENQEAYDAATERTNQAKQKMQSVINMYKANGVDTTVLENAQVMSDYYLSFNKYVPTDFSEKGLNPYNEYSMIMYAGDKNAEEMYKIAEAGDEEIQRYIESAKWSLEYAEKNGINLPENIQENLLRWIDALERQHESFEYLSYIKADDFSEQVKKGRQMAADMYEFDWAAYRNDPRLEAQPNWNLLSDEQKQKLLEMQEYADINEVARYFTSAMDQMDIENGLFGTYRLKDLLTDYEADTFYYLLATQGLEGAMTYKDHLTDGSYGVLNTRAASKTEESADKLAGSGFWGRRAADALSMLLSPVAAIGSFIYSADYGLQKLRGERVEFNPDNVTLSANIYKKEARRKIQEEINEVYKDNPALRSVMSTLQEIISNRGDSMANMIAFGGLFSGISSEMLQEFMGALPMATSAAVDAVAEAKEKGASDTQLLGIYLSTLLAESGTEAISISNIKDAFKMGVMNADGKSIGQFLKNWLTNAGISEMIGESVNDIIENKAQEIWTPDISERAELIKKYKEEYGDKISDQEAQDMAERDMIMGVLHTALVSYLSPGMDISSYLAGSFASRRNLTKWYQEHGHENVDIFNVMQYDKQQKAEFEKVLQGFKDAWKKAPESKPAETQTKTVEPGQAIAPDTGAQAQTENLPTEQQRIEVVNAPEEGAGTAVPETVTVDRYAAAYTVLDNSKQANTASQTATIASVMDSAKTVTSGDVATAAAERLDSLPGGEDRIELLTDLIVGADESNTDLDLVVQALANATLGGENSAAYQMMESDEYIHADLATKAQMLASTVQQDMANTGLQSDISKAVYESRVTAAERDLIVNNHALAKTEKAQAAVNKAMEATTQAENDLDAKNGELDAAQKNLETIQEEFSQDPSDNNLKRLNDATTRVDNADESMHQYEQHLEKMKQEQAAAETELDRVRNEEMTAVRQQAEQIVAQQDTDRAAAAAQAEEEARIQAEQEARQRVAQEESDNAHTADVESFISKLEQENGPLTEEEKQRVRDRFEQARQEQQSQQAQQQPEQQGQQEVESDVFGRLDDESARNRKKFVDEVSRRFGVQIDVVDTEAESKAKSKDGKGFRSEGYFNKENGHIVLDKNTTADDMMYRVLTHELTHIAEKSGMYDQLANSILRIMYGDDADYKTAVKSLANNGVPKTRLEADILARKKRYENRLGTELSYEYAAQEVIADRMGEVLNSKDETKRQEYINRLVGDDPSTARRILDSIKQFIKKAVGLKGAWLSNAQKTVDMLEAALNEVQGKNSPTAEQKYSLNNDYMDAVDRGDMEAAQEDVDSYAEQNGFDTQEKAYHGTDSFGFTKFDMEQSQDMIFVAYSKDMAGTYVSYEDPVVKKVSEAVKLNKPVKEMSGQELFEAAKKYLKTIEGSEVLSIDYDPKSDMYTVTTDESNYFDPNATVTQEFIEYDIKHYLQSSIDELSAGIYQFYTRPGKQLVIDADSTSWDDIPVQFSDETMSTREIAEWARDNGYDSVRINEIWDYGGNGPDLAGYGDIGIFFNQDDVKSADPVTYDDNGNVIPLNERFTDNPDIRYSLADENEAQPAAVDSDGTELTGEFKDGTQVKYSLSSWTSDEIKKVRQNLLNNGFTAEQSDKWISDVNSIAAVIAADRDRLDYTADPEKTMLKPNAEYVKTLDASTLCAKRLLYQGTFDAIQHMLPNTPLLPEDLIDLANLMREMGYETPCGICYVESRRRQLGKFTEQWLENYDGEYKPTIDQVTTSDGLEELRTSHPDTYQDFISAMNKKGTMNPKVVQLRTDYRGEIRDMTPGQVQKVKDIGGLRVQSFSDFETPHLIDMAQAVLDMSAKGLTAQAYTKVPNFPWAFGDTGIKINLSLIGKGTGLDANGNLVFDDVEGMPFDEAMKLRDRYSQNVGTILVGINDEHILAAMADDRIDFIIPFHKSGWSKEELNKMSVLNSYSDYTDSQNEKRIVGRDKKGGYKTESLEKTKAVNFQPVGENGYWDFSKSGKENAETYLKMCAEDKRLPKFSQFLVDNGDGSFSLQPDGSTDGYWKTLIDFKMYDNEGNGAPQQEVTPNINMPEANRILSEYSLGRNGISRKSNNDLPVASPVVDRYVEEYKAKHPLDENRTKYSLPSDAPYLSAVEHGDMEDAQKMVEEAAMNNGYTQKLYHGTEQFGFTQIDPKKGDDKISFFATDLLETAKTYSYETGIRELKDRPKVTEKELKTRDGYWRNDQKILDILDRLGVKYEADGTDVYGHDTYRIKEWDTSYVDRGHEYEIAYRQPLNKIAADIYNKYVGYQQIGVYQLYANPGNQLVIDGNWQKWNNIPWQAVLDATGNDPSARSAHYYDENVSTRDIAKWAKENGYDSVKIQNIYDIGGTTLKSLASKKSPANIYAFFNPNDVKSADTVIYDDDGNVVPLSERFQSNNPDIRYSLPSDDILDQQIREYLANGGSLSTNTTPPSDNQLGFPGQQAQRQFGRQTAQSSNALHDEVKDYLYNHSSYTPDSNRRQIDRAMDWVQNMASENDPDGYYAALDAVTSDGFDYRSADGQARMLTVMSMAALKAEAGDRSAMNDELRLADAFNKQGTDLGRQLQARKIFRLMTPMGRQSVLQGMADQINEQLGRKGINQTVRLSDETLKLAGEAQTEQEFTNVRKQAAKEIAEQIPSNWKDKLRGWRMLSMLGNPRTHIRNVVGNALFVPVVSLKNKMGALGEIVTRQDQRTKTLAPRVSKEIRDFAKKDALTMKDTLTGEAKYNENSMVEQEQKPFKGLLQAIIDFNGNMLEKEDWTFLKGHYKRALGGWMQANGYTAQQLENDPALLEQGRAYAIQEAQKATYRDFSKLASTLNKVSREGGIAGFITDAVLPFKKTPANILKRGIEYSPAGIMRSLTTDLYHLKQWNDYNDGKLKTLPDKAISPNQFIDRLCSGLSGTAIMAVGALLSSAGIVSCGLDDDEDKLEKEKGNQEYSFKFSIGGKDYTFTVDWAAPMSMPFFVGAAIQEQMANQEGFDVESLVDAFGNITEPVFNLSMLDGVNSLFKTSQYDDTNNLTQIGAKIASNYATSYVPSLMGAIARTVDDTRRKSFVESGKGTGVLGTARYAYEQVQNKIPGWSQTNIPARDVFGNAETSGLAERILENFILPGYVSEYKDDPVLNEMARLYDATGDANMIPKDPDKSVTYKKEKFVLTAEQWDEYKTVRGQTAYSGLTELINSDEYQKANETTQAQMIKNVWSYADKMGKQAVIPGFEMEDMGANPVTTVMKDAKITTEKSDMMTALAKGDYEGYETMVEALCEDGVEDSEIKSKISGVYRDKYKEAYRNGDDEQMAEIEEILDNTGFDFDTGAWEDQVDEKYGL